MGVHDKAFSQGGSSSPEYHTRLTKLEYVATQIYAQVCSVTDMDFVESVDNWWDWSVSSAKALLEACEEERVG